MSEFLPEKIDKLQLVTLMHNLRVTWSPETTHVCMGIIYLLKYLHSSRNSTVLSIPKYIVLSVSKLPAQAG